MLDQVRPKTSWVDVRILFQWRTRFADILAWSHGAANRKMDPSGWGSDPTDLRFSSRSFVISSI